MNKKVYATHDKHASDPVNDRVWTLSTDPNKEGWETDSGCNGYGLPKEIAEYYVRCINEYPKLLAKLDEYKGFFERVQILIETYSNNESGYYLTQLELNNQLVRFLKSIEEGDKE